MDRRRANCSAVATPRTLLPEWSSLPSRVRARVNVRVKVKIRVRASLGDQMQIPPTFGITIKMTPLLPAFPGTPTSYAHFPEESFIPHVSINGSNIRTCSGANTASPVKGFSPPLARVDAMVAMASHVEHIAQLCI